MGSPGGKTCAIIALLLTAVCFIAKADRNKKDTFAKSAYYKVGTTFVTVFKGDGTASPILQTVGTNLAKLTTTGASHTLFASKSTTRPLFVN